jgi:hypothetical protein
MLDLYLEQLMDLLVVILQEEEVLLQVILQLVLILEVSVVEEMEIKLVWLVLAVQPILVVVAVRMDQQVLLLEELMLVVQV